MSERMDERVLLDWLQYRFPLVPEPYHAVAQRLGVPVELVLEQVLDLSHRAVLRSIRGFFDAGRLNHASTLVAARVPPANLRTVAARVSAHPGVSHNYAREHDFNLWFTLTVPASWDMRQSVMVLLDGSDDFLLLPALRVFKIDARFSMSENRTRFASEAVPSARRATTFELDDLDRRAVRALNRPLPVVGRPFAELATQLELAESELLARARVFLERRIMRRYGAVLNHRLAGFTANGMTGWAVPPQDITTVGHAFAAMPEVSHCYERPTHPHWPYNLFTMIHGASRGYVDEVVARMSRASGLREYAILYSTEEFKKEPVAYFDPAMDLAIASCEEGRAWTSDCETENGSV